MGNNIKTFIKNNSFIINHVLGRNKINIPSKNSFKKGKVLMKKVNVNVKGFNNTIVIKDLAKLNNCNIYIRGNNNNILIDENAILNHAELWIEDDNNVISIGKHTTIQGTTHLAAIEGTTIRIGDDCMFSSDIHFRTGDSHSIVDMKNNRINPSKDITVDDHVWVGTKVTCLKGTNIPKNCIIGAGSIVSREFNEENTIIAGTPAKVIKSGINWLRERV